MLAKLITDAHLRSPDQDIVNVQHYSKENLANLGTQSFELLRMFLLLSCRPNLLSTNLAYSVVSCLTLMVHYQRVFLKMANGALQDLPSHY